MKKNSSKDKLNSAAILTIKDMDIMTKKGLKDIAKWLRDKADDLVDLSNSKDLAKDYSGNFKFRYMYKEKIN